MLEEQKLEKIKITPLKSPVNAVESCALAPPWDEDALPGGKIQR